MPDLSAVRKKIVYEVYGGSWELYVESVGAVLFLGLDQADKLKVLKP